jgi:hypothetical protein
MSERPSLLEQAGIPEKAQGKPTPSKGGGLSADKAKLGAAIALLVVALVAVAWGLGAFRGGPPKVSEERQSQMQERFDEQVQEEAKQEAEAPQRRTQAGG